MRACLQPVHSRPDRKNQAVRAGAHIHYADFNFGFSLAKIRRCFQLAAANPPGYSLPVSPGEDVILEALPSESLSPILATSKQGWRLVRNYASSAVSAAVSMRPLTLTYSTADQVLHT